MDAAAMPDPTTAEWAAAAVAAGLVVALAALHLLRPVLRGSPATVWGRLAGFLLATVAAGVVLCVAVVVTAASVATDHPDGPFAAVLVHDDPEMARHLAGYAAGVLLPVAALLGVLALAVVAVGRPSGLRAAAGAAAGAVLATCAFLLAGDTGPAVTGVALATLALAAAAGVALVADELAGRGRTS